MSILTSTCGISAQSDVPGGKRQAVSAARLEDINMKTLLEESGALSFFTLVRYNPPEKLNKDEDDPKEIDQSSSKERENGALHKSHSKENLSRKSSSCSKSQESEETMEEQLNAILPPRIWEHEGVLWMRTVDTNPASREDVRYLTEMLDKKLVENLAQPSGICQVRRELYGQLFEELIRQSMVSCKERGMLLLRIRNELKQTLLAYKELYLKSIEWCSKQMSKSEFSSKDLEARRNELIEENDQLKREIENMHVEVKIAKQTAEDAANKQSQIFLSEMKYYNTLNHQLRTQLDLMPDEFKGDKEAT